MLVCNTSNCLICVDLGLVCAILGSISAVNRSIRTVLRWRKSTKSLLECLSTCLSPERAPFGNKETDNGSKLSVLQLCCSLTWKGAGVPEPLGPSPLDSADLGVNFALFSQHATRVTLELFSSDGDNIQSIPLDPGSNKSGNIWHVAVQKLPLAGIEFGWRVGGEGGWETGHRWSEGKVLVDPYAPLVAGRRLFAQRDDIEQFQVKVKSQSTSSLMSSDWQGSVQTNSVLV